MAPLREVLDKVRGRGSVTLSVFAEIAPDAEIRVVGESGALGRWQPSAGLAMQILPGTSSLWSATLQAAAGGWLPEYKFVVLRPGGMVLWEPGPNRQLGHGFSGGCVFACLGDGDAGWKPVVQIARSISSHLAGYALAWKAVCSDTQLGDTLMVVGEAAALGAWDPERGVQLVTRADIWPAWYGRVLLGEVGSSWKLVIKRKNGDIAWEPGSNRRLPKMYRTAHNFDIMVVHACFGRTSESLTADQASIELDVGCSPWCSGASTPSTACPSTPHTPKEGQSYQCLLSREKLQMRRQPSFLSTCSTTDPMMDGDSPARTREVSSCGPWLWAGAHQIPKVGGRCEDAYFVSRSGIGVADGVGSLAKLTRFGVDPAAYASELMQLVDLSLQQGNSPASALSLAARADDTADEIAASAMASAEREATTYGAATATVLHMKGSTIGVANLGDSGFMVLRRAAKGFQIIARSKEQQHGWNFPYQLSRLPQTLMARMLPGSQLDTAADCERYQVLSQPGDLVLVFTDGVCDNLHNPEVLEIVERCVASCAMQKQEGSSTGLCNPAHLADEVAHAAFAKSLDEKAYTPFASASQRQGIVYSGGKGDDITIAAAWVMSPSAGSSQDLSMRRC